MNIILYASYRLSLFTYLMILWFTKSASIVKWISFIIIIAYACCFKRAISFNKSLNCKINTSFISWAESSSVSWCKWHIRTNTRICLKSFLLTTANHFIIAIYFHFSILALILHLFIYTIRHTIIRNQLIIAW